MKKSGAIAAVLATCAFLSVALAVPAVADVAERAAYKAQVEPICKQNATANKNILKGVRSKVREGKLAVAGRQFTSAAAALRKTLGQLNKVPRPADDEERLTEWLDRVSEQATLLKEAGNALIDGKKRRAEMLVSELSAGARSTNAIVVGFSFNYCRFEISQYT